MRARDDAIELPPTRGCENADEPDHPMEATRSMMVVVREKANSNRRVRRNYLSMIFLAYVLTVASPGTMLWPSYSCGDGFGATSNATSVASPDASDGGVEKCMYGPVGLSVLSQLTCSTLVLILLFFNLQGSDPGLLTDVVMRRLDASDKNNAKTTPDGSDRDGTEDDNDEVDLERQGFLDPLPPISTKGTNIPYAMHKQRGNQKLYPHTRRKFCDACHIHPPLRSHHCSDCGVCVATFDHHCQFLDTCIGERNHCRFWIFLLLNVICLRMALGIVGSSNLRLLSTGVLLEGAAIEVKMGRGILILSRVYMYPIYLVAGLLWAIHTALALGNITTFEYAKGSDHIDYMRGTSMMDFPFGRGLCGNVRIFFLRDDAFGWMLGLGKRKQCGGDVINEAESNLVGVDRWVPILWKMPDFIDLEPEDWWNHPWQNKYWSCC